MGQFIIRPELNGGTPPDWERLHEAMYAKEYYRVLPVQITWHDLPTGTYWHNSDQTLQQVFDECVAILKSIGKSNSDTNRDFELLIVHAGSENGNDKATISNLAVNKDKSKLPPNANLLGK